MKRIDRRTQAQAFITRAIHWWRRHGADESPERAATRERMSEIAGMNIETAPDEIDRRIGTSATWSECALCRRYVGSVVEVIEGAGDVVPVHLCRDCLSAAIDLLPEAVEVAP